LAAAERLSVIGMALAEAMLARVSDAVNAREPVDTGAVALEYSRLSRAVRQSLDLEARLDAQKDALAGDIAAERAAKRERAEAARNARIKANSHSINIAVGQAIKADAAGTDDKARARRLGARLRERLEDPREQDEIADRPVSELVAGICRSLGLAVDWSLWEDQDWAVAEWRAALPGSPYAPRRPDDLVPAAAHKTDRIVNGAPGAILERPPP
jgi:hypothetical protein